MRFLNHMAGDLPVIMLPQRRAEALDTIFAGPPAGKI